MTIQVSKRIVIGVPASISAACLRQEQPIYCQGKMHMTTHQEHTKTAAAIAAIECLADSTDSTAPCATHGLRSSTPQEHCEQAGILVTCFARSALLKCQSHTARLLMACASNCFILFFLRLHAQSIAHPVTVCCALPAVYTQLSTTLAGVFFPASDWITAHLSFYGVYAAGFLARPLGAVCFGHVSAKAARCGRILWQQQPMPASAAAASSKQRWRWRQQQQQQHPSSSC